MKNNKIAFTAPHWAATEAGLNILKQGGTAIEAMVSAAAVISVVYPHMNSIGGDGFWLIHNSAETEPTAIDACGRSASNLDSYESFKEIPNRGGSACITQAGTVSGWQRALAVDEAAKLPLLTILKDAINYAENGIEVTPSLVASIEKVLNEGAAPESFKDLYAPNNDILKVGDTFKNPDLAQTFKTMAQNGLDDFYQGDVAEKIIKTLGKIGSPLSQNDHKVTSAEVVEPLSIQLEGIRCFNLPAPTQGVHSLQILGQIDRLRHSVKSESEWAHLIVEATKQSFADRPYILADLDRVPSGYHEALTDNVIASKANNIKLDEALAWPFTREHGDTVWMGARDQNGQIVSFIQSIYWEFGSANVIEGAGFVWNNRGISFSLNNSDINRLEPNKKPRHTLNPAMALFENGQRLSYGTMGGEGQPQTQATLFSRFVWQNKTLEESIAQGRWLLGRTWGDSSNDLKVEADIAQTIGKDLTELGHQWQEVPAVNEMMGHAGAIFDDQGELTAATDPRSDGKAVVVELATS